MLITVYLQLLLGLYLLTYIYSLCLSTLLCGNVNSIVQILRTTVSSSKSRCHSARPRTLKPEHIYPQHFRVRVRGEQAHEAETAKSFPGSAPNNADSDDSCVGDGVVKQSINHLKKKPSIRELVCQSKNIVVMLSGGGSSRLWIQQDTINLVLNDSNSVTNGDATATMEGVAMKDSSGPEDTC